MDEWVQYGAKKMRIDDETEFVDQEVLTKVLDCKTVFDNLEDKELRTARTRSNPFETIGRGIFQVWFAENAHAQTSKVKQSQPGNSPALHVSFTELHNNHIQG